MSFSEVEAYLDALGIDAMKKLRPSTLRIEAMCAALNDPQNTVPAIHVTGTNGKTSVARIASSVLTATGLTTAAYTSPHLQTVRERLSLGGREISQDDFASVFDHMQPYLRHVEAELGESLSYFEVLTAMFFLWAAEVADAAVVEVGLGGRWDATNVVPAPVAVITNVGLDHTGLLGGDRVTIAKEKAGIVKPGAVVVSAERDPEVLGVIEGEAEQAGGTLLSLDRAFAVTDNRVAVGGRFLSMRLDARAYEGLFLPLHGAHQGINAAVALQAVTSFLPARELDDDVIAQGLAQVFVPGRLEQLIRDEQSPPVVLDVAHNPGGMSALIAGLVEGFAFDRVTFVIGILRDKDHKGMLLELCRIPCRLIVTEAASARSVPAEELRALAEELGIAAEVAARVPDAVDRAIGSTEPSEMVCVTGSHYVVGEARDHLLASPP